MMYNNDIDFAQGNVSSYHNFDFVFIRVTYLDEC